jgi:hypothetical protein
MCCIDMLLQSPRKSKKQVTYRRTTNKSRIIQLQVLHSVATTKFHTRYECTQGKRTVRDSIVCLCLNASANNDGHTSVTNISCERGYSSNKIFGPKSKGICTKYSLFHLGNRTEHFVMYVHYILLPFIWLIWLSLYLHPANYHTHNLYMLRSYFLTNFYYNSLLLYKPCYLLFLVKIYRTIILPVVCVGVKLGRWHSGRNVGWGCLRIGCGGEYLGLRGTR